MKKYLVVLLLITGCDPALPSASGTLFLGANIDSKEFKSLYVRAFPSPDFALTVQDLPTAESLPAMVVCSLEGIEFPYNYTPGTNLGLEDRARYQVFAWISKEDVDPERKFPASGDVYGQAQFEAKKCGVFQKGYCGETTGVDIQLEQTMP